MLPAVEREVRRGRTPRADHNPRTADREPTPERAPMADAGPAEAKIKVPMTVIHALEPVQVMQRDIDSLLQRRTNKVAGLAIALGAWEEKTPEILRRITRNRAVYARMGLSASETPEEYTRVSRILNAAWHYLDGDAKSEPVHLAVPRPVNAAVKQLAKKLEASGWMVKRIDAGVKTLRVILQPRPANAAQEG